MRTCLVSFRRRPGFVAACFLCSLFAAPLLTVGRPERKRALPIGRRRRRVVRVVRPEAGRPAAKRARDGRSRPKRSSWAVPAAQISRSLDSCRAARRSPPRRPPPLGRRSVQQQPVLARLFRRAESQLDLSRPVRRRRGVLVFQHLHPKRHQDGRPHQSDDAGLAGHVRAWLVLADPGFPVPGHGLERTPPTFTAPRLRAAGSFPKGDLAGGLRWLQLNDELVGWFTPADRNAPDWKKHCLGSTLDNLPTTFHQISIRVGRQEITGHFGRRRRKTIFTAAKSASTPNCWRSVVFRSMR